MLKIKDVIEAIHEYECDLNKKPNYVFINYKYRDMFIAELKNNVYTNYDYSSGDLTIFGILIKFETLISLNKIILQ